MRTSSIIHATRICHTTEDLREAMRIFFQIIPELRFDPVLLKILVKGLLGVKNLSSLTPRNPHQSEEIELDRYPF